MNSEDATKNHHEQQQQQQPLPPAAMTQAQPQAKPAAITSNDLDVEESEGDLLRSVEQRRANDRGSAQGPSNGFDVLQQQQQQQQSQTFTSVSGVSEHNYSGMASTNNNHSNSNHNNRVQNHVRSLEAAMKARRKLSNSRMDLVKMTARKTQQAMASHLLHELDWNGHHHSSSGIPAVTGSASSSSSTEEDGIMKTIAAVRKEKEHRPFYYSSDPYASNLDHHYLISSAKLERNPSDENQLTTAYNKNTTVASPKNGLGLFHRRTTSNSSYNNNHNHHQHHHQLPYKNTDNNNSHHSSEQDTHPLPLPLHEQQRQQQQQQQMMTGYVATYRDGTCAAYPGTRPAMYATGRSHYSYPTAPTTTYHTTIPSSNKKRRKWLPRWVRELCSMCHPFRVFQNCTDILVQSHFLWVGVPCLLGSAFCCYLLDNPTLYFLPGETPLAVWLLFVCRQTVTLGLARLTVYILIDGLMLGTHLAVQTLGPLITLAAATGKGWPAITAIWGLWNLVLIHGDTPFQLNWFYWTGMVLFNQNFGGLLVNSVLYTRVLFAAIFTGLFVSAKRTLFALKFGRKQVADFKPRLKRILTDVVVLDEIATLAEQAEKVGTDDNRKDTDDDDEDDDDDDKGDGADDKAGVSWEFDLMNPSNIMDGVQQNLNDLLWVPKIEYQESNTSDFENESTTEDNQDGKSVAGSSRPNLQGNSDEETAGAGNTKRIRFADSPVDKHSKELRRTESGRLKIKDMLDSWEEPESGSDNAYSDITIHDILRFRRALSHLEEENIFGDAFGSTVSRDQCITNAHVVYYRLLKLAEKDSSGDGRIQEGVLPFDILALLCLVDGNGTIENLNKKRKIRKLFIPDKNGELPLLAFIQAVDQCYKRLVFLRASLRNSSLLDGVLEKLFNGIFYFIMVFFLSSVLQLHPWTLMVSITSILVSMSFAFGSSVSAYVNGILLIAIRRPFDLGE